MQALKGRASYLGPRSVGHEDPGAVSTALILGALRDAARARPAAMTGPSRYRGQPVSEGIGLGEIYQGDPSRTRTNGHRQAATEDEVRAAFAAVARDRAALAADLRANGQDQQAAIVDIAALIAADPALVTPAVEAVRAGADGADAIRQAGEAQAALLAALPDPDLAQRAGDVRQVARAVADYLGNKKCRSAPGREVHPGPPRGRPGRPHPAGRGRAGRCGIGRRRGQLARGHHRPRPRPADAGRRRPDGPRHPERAPRDPRRRARAS